MRIPDDVLAGRQHITSGRIEMGDIIANEAMWGYAGGTWAGIEITTLDEGLRVYRVVPVPKQGGVEAGYVLEQQRNGIVISAANPDAAPRPEQLLDATREARQEIYAEKPAEKAMTYDEGKAPLAYIPWAAVDGMALVQAYGHKKYKDWNNYRKGMEVGRNLSCAIRHIRDFMNGMDVDPESKRSPLEHAMCRVAFVLQNIADGTAIDDRYKAST